MAVYPGFARAIFLACRMRSLDVVEIAGSVGIATDSLADPDLEIEFSTLLALWGEAARRANDPLFGLHVAEDVHRAGAMGVFGLLDFVMSTSANLEELLERFGRYQGLLGERSVTYTADETTGTIRTIWPGDPEVLRHHVEFNTSIGVMRVRGLAGFDLAPRVFRFRHAAADLEAYRRHFPARIELGADADDVVFDRAHLARPLYTSNPELCAVLDRRAQDLATKVALGGELSERITRHLAHALPGGDVDLASVAKALHISERTLQRRLGDENTSFAQVLDATRLALAKNHLAHGQTSIAEIAFLLGYSEPAAFHRAYQRWTGTTPRAARGATSSKAPT
ncbi:MAG: AraC family transcriptional regulator ligand-binding domain-containing protein [Kofleriaceae bacterium]